MYHIVDCPAPKRGLVFPPYVNDIRGRHLSISAFLFYCWSFLFKLVIDLIVKEAVMTRLTKRLTTEEIRRTRCEFDFASFEAKCHAEHEQSCSGDMILGPL